MRTLPAVSTLSDAVQEVIQSNRADKYQPQYFRLHDRDGKFPPRFDAVFRSEGSDIVLTPPRLPQANGAAERWVRSVRQECLDQMLILNERHLLRVLTTYVRFYNERRPHQGLDQACPVPLAPSPGSGPIQCRDVLGGILHDFYRAAACGIGFRILQGCRRFEPGLPLHFFGEL